MLVATDIEGNENKEFGIQRKEDVPVISHPTCVYLTTLPPSPPLISTRSLLSFFRLRASLSGEPVEEVLTLAASVARDSRSAATLSSKHVALRRQGT